MNSACKYMVVICWQISFTMICLPRLIPDLWFFLLFREVHEEVNQEREKVSELKLRRQEQAEARREKLRQAYLRKLLEKQKVASNTEQK